MMRSEQLALIESQTKLSISERGLSNHFQDPLSMLPIFRRRQLVYKLLLLVLISCVFISIYIGIFHDKEFGAGCFIASTSAALLFDNYFKPMELLLQSYRYMAFGDETDAQIDEVYKATVQEVLECAARNEIDISKYFDKDTAVGAVQRYKNLCCSTVIIFKYFEDRNIAQREVATSTVDMINRHMVDIDKKNDELSQLTLNLQKLNKEIEVERSRKSELEKQNRTLSNNAKIDSVQFRKIDQKLQQCQNEFRTWKTKSSREFKEEKAEHVRTRENFLNSTTAHDLIYHLTEWLHRPATSDVKFSDSEKQKVAVMYAAMHEFLPDKERIKELALIPHETLRAQQVETIVNHYSSLIMTANKDEDLSDDEREDKMNAYRMARESELQAFHGGG